MGDLLIFTQEEDKCIWTGDLSGLYSIKTGVGLALKGDDSRSRFGSLAQLGVVPPWVQSFV